MVDGTLVWSKKTRGMGFFNKASDTDRQPVFTAIQGSSGEEKTSMAFVLPGAGSINSLNVPLLDGESSDGTGTPKKKGTKMQLCCSLCTTVAAIPAIIGA